MTQSIPAKPDPPADEVARHQRLMELIEAEDAANGEVGCGWNTDRSFLNFLSIRGITFDEERLKSLLRPHLEQLLKEPDFDSIAAQIQRRLEALLIPPPNQALKPVSLSVAEIKEYISTKELRNFFQTELAGRCPEEVVGRLVQVSHEVIHKTVLRPRHTWSEPLWVLKGETQIYVVQATRIEEAIAKIRTQFPAGTGELEVIQVRGVLAPDQVVALDKSLL